MEDKVSIFASISLGIIMLFAAWKVIDLVRDLKIFSFLEDRKKVLIERKFSFDQEIYPCVVVGGGVAGLTAASYFARSGYKPLVFAGKNPGGSALKARSIFNWPGAPGISGAKLADNILAQAKSAGAIVRPEIISKVDFSSWPFIVELQDSSGNLRNIQTLTFIVASGSKPKMLGVEGEAKYFNKQGLYTCVVCDSDELKDKDVVVVGSTVCAMKQVWYLSGIAKSVKVLIPGKSVTIEKGFASQIEALPNVKFFYSTSLFKILGDEKKVTSVECKVSGKNELLTLEADGVIYSMGSKPNTNFLFNQVELDESGHVLCFDGQQSSLEGVYAAGDVCKNIYNQLIIGAGQGCKAALQAIDFLRKKNIQTDKFNYERFTSINTEKKVLKIEENHNDSEEEGVKEIKLENDSLAVVNFTYEWALDSKLNSQILNEALASFNKNIKVLNIDVDSEESEDLVEKYEVESVPTVFVVNASGEILGKKFEGVLDKDDFIQNLKNVF